MIVTLSADGLTPLAIGDGSNTLCLTGYDLGAPEHRTNVMDAPDTHGTLDFTTLEGGRVLTFGIGCKPYVWADVQALKAYTRADLRPTLTITDPSLPALQTVGRISPFGDQANIGQYKLGEQREFVLQFFGERGILESADLHQVAVLPGDGGSAGLEFDPTLEFGPTLEFPFTEPPGVAVVTNAGDRDAFPVLLAYGPFGGALSTDNVVIGNETTGLELVFAGLQVLAGDYLEIDVRAKTILLNGDPAQSLYDRLDFPSSDWWVLVPGENVVVFQPETSSGDSQMVVQWRSAYS